MARLCSVVAGVMLCCGIIRYKTSGIEVLVADFIIGSEVGRN